MNTDVSPASAAMDGPGHSADAKTVSIVVNGRLRSVTKNQDLAFERIVALAFDPLPVGDGVQFTVQFTRGPQNKPTGTLIEGQSVKAKPTLFIVPSLG
ncbi:MAG: hypothetical protein ACLGJC_20760 [Alphaproteobacteria bacterium]